MCKEEKEIPFSLLMNTRSYFRGTPNDLLVLYLLNSHAPSRYLVLPTRPLQIIRLGTLLVASSARITPLVDGLESIDEDIAFESRRRSIDTV